MPTTTYGRNKIIDAMTGVAAYAWPTLWLSLHTADPGLSGSYAAEVGPGLGYARLSLAGLMGAASDGVSIDTALVTLGPATADWGTIIFLGLNDSSVLGSGNMLVTGAPSQPRTITAGQPFQIPISQLFLSLR